MAHAGTAEQPIRLGRAQREVLDAHLHQPTVGAQAGESDVREGSRRERKGRALGDGAGDRRYRVHDRWVRQAVEVVQDEHERLRPRGERELRRESTRAELAPSATRWTRARALDRLDPIERDRDVSQEHNRVAVGLVHRDPCERASVALGPLREQVVLPALRVP